MNLKDKAFVKYCWVDMLNSWEAKSCYIAGYERAIEDVKKEIEVTKPAIKCSYDLSMLNRLKEVVEGLKK